MNIKTILDNIVYKEDEKTLKIFNLLNQNTKYLDKNALIQILKWKSPRPLRFYNQNEEVYINYITKLAFKEKDDRLKIHILTTLKGVNYPSASAILMFKDPVNFPVLDIRVWKLLYKSGLVTVNSRGIGFSLDQWVLYLKILRSLSKEYETSTREIEKKLFDYDRLNQSGNLY